MKFQEALIKGEPLLIEPKLLEAFVASIPQAGLTDRIKELFGERPQMTIENGVATIPIDGPIGRGLSPIEKLLGASDTLDIERDFNEASDRPDIHTILLEIHSPGGLVTGIPELAETIAESKKPTKAFASSMAASAAYWLGSQADSFYATPSATVGGVGVFVPVVDMSMAAAMQGIKVDVIKAGKYKAAGLPGTSLEPDQRSLMQERVNQIHSMFKQSVKKKRSMVCEDCMEGQIFYGREASEKHLVTGLVKSKAELLGKLTRRTMPYDD